MTTDYKKRINQLVHRYTRDMEKSERRFTRCTEHRNAGTYLEPESGEPYVYDESVPEQGKAWEIAKTLVWADGWAGKWSRGDRVPDELL